MRNYPKLGKVTKLKKPPMCKCGEVALYHVEVQINNMRGDDDFYFACESHKRDLSFLRGDIRIKQ